jgi:hypothetical protein
MSAFPISREVSNKVRNAWSEGVKAASGVRWQVDTIMTTNLSDDVMYESIDLGSPMGRVRGEIYALAKDHGICINTAYCDALSSVFERTDASLLVWLHEQSTRRDISYSDGQHITSHRMQDESRIEVFTVYQAFVFGYYYAVFLPLVDTSSLAIQTVSGSWGFRSAEAMDVVREHAVLNEPTREGMQIILAALCFSQVKSIPDQGMLSRCLGIIGKRALLVNSLVAASDSPQAVGRFTMLDVAVGHIPSDIDGLVRPGEPTLFCEEEDFIDPSIQNVRTVIPTAPDVDFTKHIEPDWDGNPETVLLVMRYKGRRIATLSPALSDREICHTYIDPVEEPQLNQEVPLAIGFTIKDFLARKCLYPMPGDNTKVVVHSKNMPNMRYTAASAYPMPAWRRRCKGIRPHVALASNCVVAATLENVLVIVT